MRSPVGLVFSSSLISTAVLFSGLVSGLVSGCSDTDPAGFGGEVDVHGVGGACSKKSDCRQELDCATDDTCEPPATTIAGDKCTYSAECLPSGPPLYCSDLGVCDTAGTVAVNGTCSDTSNCVRGAVCFRPGPMLYGVCLLPRGTISGGAGDGGTSGTGGTGGTGSGMSGDAAANGDGGASVGSGPSDLGQKCADTLDCVAGLVCDPSALTCETAASALAAMSIWPGEICTDTPSTDGSVRVYFEVPAADGTPAHDFFRLPFPNDIRRDPTTGHPNLKGFPTPGNGPIGFDLVDRYARASETDLDGFGVNQQVYFRFSAPYDFNTLAIGSNLRIIDLTTGNDAGYTRYSASTGFQGKYLCQDNVLVSVPRGRPFTEGHTYAVILGNTIMDNGSTANGVTIPPKPVTADADFTTVMAATAPADPNLAHAWNAYAPLRAYLVAHPLTGGLELVGAAVFTTQHVANHVGDLRDAVLAQPAPLPHGFVRCDTGVVSPCDDGLTGTDHVRGCMGAADPAFDELQGTIDVPYFQHGTRPYSTPGDGAIVIDSMGHPTVQGTEQVCVSITVPHGVAAPSGGWPVVLYAHGTGGGFRSAITEGLAKLYTSIDLGSGSTAHFASLCYDGVMHGNRRGPGVTGSPDDLFFNFANPQAARDNVLQGSADIFAFVRALQTVKLPMLPTASATTEFDPTKIYFVGHSQGSSVGLPASAYEPGLAGMVYSGAGADLRVALTSKQNPVNIAQLAPVVFEEAVDPASDEHPALNMFQAYFERADPVNYGNLVLWASPPAVKVARPVVETYGIGDTYAPDATLQIMNVALGLPAVSPVPGGMSAFNGQGGPISLPVNDNLSATLGKTTGALLEADPGTAYDGHFVLQNDPTLRGQVMTFLGTAATTGSATIR